MSPGTASDCAAWALGGHEFKVEYDRGVLDEIRALVVDGFNKVPRGGIETGGILLGRKEGAAVRITGFRQLPIEYKTGPSFTLSENDHRQLAAMLSAPGREGAEPVGWFHSHNRSDLQLSESDIAIHARYFPEAWNVALVLKPHKWDPVRAAFFFRAPDGTIVGGADAALELLPVRKAEPAGAGAPAAAPIATQVRPRRAWRHIAAAAALAAIAGYAGLQSRPDPALSLRFADENGHMTISWNRESPAIQHAERAVLDIGDGGQAVALLLTPPQARNGSVTYLRSGGSVTVRLRVEPRGGPPVEELATFLGTPVVRPAVEVADRAAPEQAAQPEPEPAPAVPAKSEELAVTPRPQPKAFALRLPARESEPVLLAGAPSLDGAAPVGRLPLRLHLPAPAPGPAAAPKPTAGRIIWTGHLKRREYLVIEGSHSSTGFLSGELPSMPVRLRVYPADLTGDGLRLYAANAAHAGSDEAPTAANGWNRTRFVVDPDLAGALQVLEPPARTNGWKRLVLRSERRNHNVVVIQWEPL